MKKYIRKQFRVSEQGIDVDVSTFYSERCIHIFNGHVLSHFIPKTKMHDPSFASGNLVVIYHYSLMLNAKTYKSLQ